VTLDKDEPVYAIGVVARMVGLHAQTLRNYERWGFLKPQRMGGRVRLYSQRDVERIKQVNDWMEGLGINVAGVEVMTRLRVRISELEGQVARLTIEVVNLKGGPRLLPGPGTHSPPAPTAARRRR